MIGNQSQFQKKLKSTYITRASWQRPQVNDIKTTKIQELD